MEDYKILTGYIHLLLAHGRVYIEWDQETLNICLGALPEKPIEMVNKLNKTGTAIFTRKIKSFEQKAKYNIRQLCIFNPLPWYQENKVMFSPGKIRKPN